MSARKRARPSEPCSEPTSRPRLYKLVPGNGKPTDPIISSTFPIYPNIGWMLLNETCKFDMSKERCYLFILPGIEMNYQKHTKPVLGFELQVFAPEPSFRADCLRFAIYLRVGDDDTGKSLINTLDLHPKTLIMEMVSGNGKKLSNMELNVFPGVTPDFNPKAVESPENDRCVVYHGCFDKEHPQWCDQIAEFLWSSTRSQLATIEIKHARKFTQIQKQFKLLPTTVLTPFTLVDNENHKHACYKEVLAGEVYIEDSRQNLQLI